jgi:manganese oxidase
MDESIDPEHLDQRPPGLLGRHTEALTFGAITALALAVTVAVSLVTADGPAVTAAAAGKDPSTAAGKYEPQTRTYYIGADSVPWNYAPDGKNDISGEPWDDVAGTFTVAGPDRIGTTYVKSLYREYTDDTFSTLQPRSPEWEHLGDLGPVIHVAVGDKLRIVFRNGLDRPASIHMHGLLYEKSSEGARYDDGTSDDQKPDDGVAPGDTYTYEYSVPKRAGPGPMDASSVMWMYHSHVDEIGDTNSGLVGPVIVTSADKATPDGTPEDVDRELVALFSVTDENVSPDLAQNMAALTAPPDPQDEGFEESNLMHNINGYVFGNQPLGTKAGEGMTVRKGERVRWYVMAMGTEVDLHTPHWHGETVVINGMRTDVASLLPAQMVVADMTPDASGIWLFHCHVNDHIAAGMMTRFQVVS